MAALTHRFQRGLGRHFGGQQHGKLAGEDRLQFGRQPGAAAAETEARLAGLRVEFGDEEALREAIDRGAPESELKSIALGASETLIGQGLTQVARGETSIAETLRVVGDVA